ncbi:ABC-type bacteriocin/lantibiotic exporter with double-glycine peptidase domain [Roseibium hamelinense]|uniref:ABC-type bacteriocin/lantibiotic exporter with double-glycine peptidase domain n=1 Tax=Roseibium hamelinense TaxID=150831 RepID=A0A562SCV6_9HYPH|nr:ATP-binding cassette domain-containing protein [Roseibium hamelinense]MTI42042.1 ATP-binding cassette domain-containing protein [Roseibium hamelinense]TWI78684.1 ABC-type bacteriocin/lantibiotic exporter with double-glycine peptidase domain [Roseibium hamelinense]
MNVQSGLTRQTAALETSAVIPSRQPSDLEAILLKSLAGLGWRRSDDVLTAAMPHESNVRTLDEAAMVLDLVDVGASVETKIPAAWRSGLDGALIVQDKHGVHALIREDSRETVVSSSNLTPEKTAHRVGAAEKLLFIHNPEHPVAAVHAVSIRNRIKRGVGTALFLSLIINALALFIPFFSMTIFDRVLGAQASQSLVPLLTGAGVVLLAILVLRSFRSRLLAAEYARLGSTVRLMSLSRILRLPHAMRQRLGFDRLQNRLQSTAQSAEVFASQNTAAIFDAPFVPLSIFAIAFVGGWMAVVPAVYLTLFFSLSWVLSETRQSLDPQLENANAKRVEALTELSSKAADIQHIDHGASWFARFASTARQAAFAKHRQATRSAALQSLAYVLGTGAALTTLCVGLALAMQGAITAGALIGTMLLTWRVTGPSQAFFLALPRLKGIRTAISGLDQAFSWGTSQARPAALEKLDVGAPAISGKGLYFKYDQSAEPAITGVTFECAPGSLTIVIGPNGSGKSTFLKMVSGLLLPQSGRLSLNGRSVTQYDPDDLARATYYSRLENLGDGTLADRDPKPALAEHSQNNESFDPTCRLIVLDDTGGSGANGGRTGLRALLEQVKGTATVFLATHDTSLAELADNALVLDEGAPAYFGPVTPPGQQTISPSKGMS